MCIINLFTNEKVLLVEYFVDILYYVSSLCSMLKHPFCCAIRRACGYLLAFQQVLHSRKAASIPLYYSIYDDSNEIQGWNDLVSEIAA